MSGPTTNAQVLSKKIHRARRDHRLSISILAMLAGLTEEQVQSLETDAPQGFIEEAHRVHCACRLAVALGYPEDHFLEHHTPAAAPERASSTRFDIPKADWHGLAAAELTILDGVQKINLPASSELFAQNARRYTAASAAPLIATLVALIFLGLSLVI